MKTVKLAVFISGLLFGSMLYAASLKDLSGEYKCIIDDKHDGVFTVTDIFTRDKRHSTDTVSGYTVKMLDDQNKPSKYFGFASFDGESLSIYTDSTETGSNDYAIVVAELTKTGFNSHYYQPAYNGGNTGSAACLKIT